jgi:predicted nuclease with TOPRIM domain
MDGNNKLDRLVNETLPRMISEMRECFELNVEILADTKFLHEMIAKLKAEAAERDKTIDRLQRDNTYLESMNARLEDQVRSFASEYRS